MPFFVELTSQIGSSPLWLKGFADGVESRAPGKWSASLMLGRDPATRGAEGRRSSVRPLVEVDVGGVVRGKEYGRWKNLFLSSSLCSAEGATTMQVRCGIVVGLLFFATDGCSAQSIVKALPFDRDWVLENYRAGPDSKLGTLGGTRGRLSSGALEVDFSFVPTDPDRQQLEVMHELDVAGEPFGRTSDLLGATLSAVISMPSNLLSRSQAGRVAGLQLFCESENKDGIKGRQYSDWLDLDRATWNGRVEFQPNTRKSTLGWLDPAWRPDRIWSCGIKVALNDRARERIGGTIKVEAFSIRLPSSDVHRAAKAEMLRSIPQTPPDTVTLGRLRALEARVPEQQILPVDGTLTPSAAVSSIAVVPEPARGGTNVWVVQIRFQEYREAAEQRTARVTLPLSPPIDLRGKTITTWVAMGPSLRGAILRPNLVQMELEDTDGRLLRGPASAVSDAGFELDDRGLETASRWVKVQATPVSERPLAMGSVADNFAPAQIRKIHLRFQIGKSSHELRDESYPLTGRLLLSEFRIDKDPNVQEPGTVAERLVPFDKKPVAPDQFTVGLNLPFYFYADVGLFPFGGRDIGGFSARPDKLQRHFALFRKNKIDAVRVFLLGDLRTGVTRDGAGKVNGLDQYALKDIDSLLAAAATHRVALVPVLVDFLALDGQLERSYGSKHWKDGEARKDILDPDYRPAFIENGLKPIVKQLNAANLRQPNTVWAVDIFNEAENSVAITSQVDFQELVRFVGQVNDMIHREAPGLKTTVGSRDRRDLVAYWSAIGDVHQYHFYSKHEEEDGLPLRFPAGNLGLKGPVIVGEVEPDQLTERLDAIYESGYDGAFFWSYSGHDGYKVDLDEIRRWVENKRR